MLNEKQLTTVFTYICCFQVQVNLLEDKHDGIIENQHICIVSPKMHSLP